MAKVTLNDVASGYNRQKINENFTDIEAEFQNKVLYRDNPDGEPNQLENDIDMNSNTVYNLRKAVNNTEAVNFEQLTDTVNGAAGPFTQRLREPRIVASDGQTTFNLSTYTYVPGINNLQVYVNGVAQVANVDYLESSTTSITFTSGLNAGDTVDMYTNEATTSKVTATINVEDKRYNSVSEMVGDSDLVEGNLVKTVGYYSAGDGGGNDYEIVAGGTGTDDGGSFIDLDSGLQAKGLFNYKVSPKQFGAKGDSNNNDTIALSSFFDFGGDLYADDDSEFLFDELSIGNEFRLSGKGKFKYSGAVVSNNVALRINSSFQADYFNITGDGGAEDAYNVIEVSSDNVSIGELNLSFGTERTPEGGCEFYGNNIQIDKFVSVNVARPFDAKPNPDLDPSERSEIHLGKVYIRNYLRGVRFKLAAKFSVGSVFVFERYSTATFSPGLNGVLVEDCRQFDIGNCYFSDAPEHSFRLGGTSENYDFSIGKIITLNSGGCSLKINSTNTTYNGSVESVTGIDTGEGSNAGNKEVVRLSKTKDINIGEISAKERCTRALIISDIENLSVGHIHGENVKARLIQTDEDQDGTSGNIDGVYVGSYYATMDGARSVFGLVYGTGGSRSISNVVIGKGFSTGQTNFLADTSNSTISGLISISGYVGENDPAPNVENAVNTKDLILDVCRQDTRYIGKAFDFDFSDASIGLSDANFDRSTNFVRKGTLYLSSNSASSGQDELGSAIAFSRVGSTRRGAAIASKQITSDNFETGLAFFTGDSSTSTNESVDENMVLKHNGVLNLPNLPTYADDSAAATGGLVSGDIYQTSTGELRVKL